MPSDLYSVASYVFFIHLTGLRTVLFLWFPMGGLNSSSKDDRWQVSPHSKDSHRRIPSLFPGLCGRGLEDSRGSSQGSIVSPVHSTVALPLSFSGVQGLLPSLHQMRGLLRQSFRGTRRPPSMKDRQPLAGTHLFMQ